MTRMLRTHAAYNDCLEMSSSTNIADGPVLNYLVQYLLILFSAEIESEISKIVCMKASSIEDDQVREYLIRTCSRNLRSVEKGEIATFVSKFGNSSRDKFNNLLIDDKKVTLYNNAIKQRHSVAHRSNQSSNLTLKEFSEALDIAVEILDAFKEALNVN